MHCKHDKCHCHGSDVQQDGYCSETCRSGTTNAAGNCDCGHSDCK